MEIPATVHLPVGAVESVNEAKTPFYKSLSIQVLVAIAIAVLLGYFSPARAIAMKPLGDAFIRLITMIITVIIFCTVVTGIAGMEDMKKVGRVGGKALLYFEVVSTLALFIGLLVGNLVRPGNLVIVGAVQRIVLAIRRALRGGVRRHRDIERLDDLETDGMAPFLRELLH